MKTTTGLTADGIRSALVRATGSLGLLIQQSGTKAVGHIENYQNAKRVLALEEADNPEHMFEILMHCFGFNHARAAREQEVRELVEALRPFAEYAKMRKAKPMSGMHDIIHGIHPGTEWEAEIRLSHCNAAMALLAQHTPAPTTPPLSKEERNNKSMMAARRLIDAEGSPE